MNPLISASGRLNAKKNISALRYYSVISLSKCAQKKHLFCLVAMFL